MNTCDRIIVGLCGVLLGLLVRMSPAHADDTLVTKQSHYTVAETIDRIARAVTDKGMFLFARINHADEARKVGLEMPPTELLLFGNPRGGTALMLAAPTVAIDLPMKALAWQDRAGRVWLTYNAPALLPVRHGLAAELAARLDPVGTLLERAVE
ncbi:MAG: DUF302 domain-containing protein [Nitrospira sp.]|nr:DUF302 domain-containing protein [Nitrospira sp.]